MQAEWGLEMVPDESIVDAGEQEEEDNDQDV